MKFISKLGVLLALSLLAVVQSSAAGLDGVYLQSLTYGGTGVPQGTVGQSISSDRKVFTLIFDAFVASSGPSVPIGESRKSGQFNVNVASTKLHGTDKAVLTETLRGYVQLPAGVVGTVSTLSYDEKGKQTFSTQSFYGPVAKDYIFAVSNKVKVKNGRVTAEVVKVTVTLTGNHAAQAQMTVDSLDGLISAKAQHEGEDSVADSDETDGD